MSGRAVADETLPAKAPAGRRYRIAYLVSHPIQYQVPLFRLMAAQPDIDLTVFFQSDFSAKRFHDDGFGRTVSWDIPLLEGYRHEVLPALGRRDHNNPLSYGIFSRLRKGKFDVLWVHGYARWFNWLAMIAARLNSTAVFVRDDPSAKSTTRSRLKIMLKRAIFFPGLRALVDGFLAIGSLNRDYYTANGIPADRVYLMPYCVDNDYFRELAAAAAPHREQFRQRLGLSPGRPVILYASKFQRRKHAGDVIHAVRKIAERRSVTPQPYLLMVGDGEMREELEAQAHGLADVVRFLGFRNQSELPAFFDLCDVFVLPAEFEPWGLVVNEAMSVARAVIVSDHVGAAVDLVENGKNGFIFPARDTDALARALESVLRSPKISKEMGSASAEIIAGWTFKHDLAVLKQALVAVNS